MTCTDWICRACRGVINTTLVCRACGARYTIGELHYEWRPRLAANGKTAWIRVKTRESADPRGFPRNLGSGA